MKRLMIFFLGGLVTIPALGEEGCYDKVEEGDPMQYVIERCGKPVRRERETLARGQRIEVIRGSNTLHSQPVQPQQMEKWYYDTSRDKATLIVIQDGGVIGKRRLERMPDNDAQME